MVQKSQLTEQWVFLRGLAREKAHWSEFLESFARRVPSAEVCALDLPGFGEQHEATSPTSLREIVENLRGQIANPPKQRFLVGISLGAMVALEWSHAYPADFAGVAFINISLPGVSPFYRRFRPSAYWNGLQVLSSQKPETQEKHVLNMVSNREQNREELAPKWAAIYKERPFASANVLKQLYAAYRGPSSRARPKVPALLLVSAADRMVHPSCTRKVGKAWKLRPIEHPTAGHDLPLDEPDWTLFQLQQWRKTIVL